MGSGMCPHPSAPRTNHVRRRLQRRSMRSDSRIRGASPHQEDRDVVFPPFSPSHDAHHARPGGAPRGCLQRPRAAHQRAAGARRLGLDVPEAHRRPVPHRRRQGRALDVREPPARCERPRRRPADLRRDRGRPRRGCLRRQRAGRTRGRFRPGHVAAHHPRDASEGRHPHRALAGAGGRRPSRCAGPRRHRARHRRCRVLRRRRARGRGAAGASRHRGRPAHHRLRPLPRCQHELRGVGNLRERPAATPSNCRPSATVRSPAHCPPARTGPRWPTPSPPPPW